MIYLPWLLTFFQQQISKENLSQSQMFDLSPVIMLQVKERVSSITIR